MSMSFRKSIRGAMGLCALSFMLTSCVSLQSVSMTQIPSDRDDKVSASADQFLFLNIAFDNDFVNDVNKQLLERCKGGRITGILTKHEYINYFLHIFARRRVTADGFCLKKA